MEATTFPGEKLPEGEVYSPGRQQQLVQLQPQVIIVKHEADDGWRRRRPSLPVRLLILAMVTCFLYLSVSSANANFRARYYSVVVPEPATTTTTTFGSGSNPRTGPGRFSLCAKRPFEFGLKTLSGLTEQLGGVMARAKRQAGGGGGGGGGQPGRRRRVLEVFQVSQPVLRQTANTIDKGQAEPAAEVCKVLLMDHVFGLSYGKPFVGNYVPPSCEFNRVVMNFSVVSEGRQFDRLAIMYLNDTEVWRTSTAEPVAAPGIHWEYHKDMTQYLYFWRQPQRLIFDLGNLIDNTYTGSFNTTLTASFFMSAVKTETSPPADLIIPITGRNASSGSANPISQFTLPEDAASVTVPVFPRNAHRAVLSVSACGQAAEEFWWSNVLESDRYTFNETNGEAMGLSPFREVQALIDGRLAGVQWPFPVIFTGGVVPTFHRPVVGLQAFDLREHEIDITPWLPLLCDGSPHTFAFRISGLKDDGVSKAQLTDGVDASWYLTGKVFVWLDDEGSITTGTPPQISGVDPVISIGRNLQQNAQGINQSVAYFVNVQRQLTISSTVVSQRNTTAVAWTQKLSYINQADVTGFGLDQNVNFNVQGSDTSLRNGSESVYGLDYHYPVRSNMTLAYGPQGGMSIRATLYQGLDLQVAGAATFPDGLEAFAERQPDGRTYAASTLSTYRDGTASFAQNANRQTTQAQGFTRQEFSFGGNFARYDPSSRGGFQAPDVQLYYRNVTANNDAVVSDRESVRNQVVVDVQPQDSSGQVLPTSSSSSSSPAGGGDGQGGSSSSSSGLGVTMPRFGPFRKLPKFQGEQAPLFTQQQERDYI